MWAVEGGAIDFGASSSYISIASVEVHLKSGCTILMIESTPIQAKLTINDIRLLSHLLQIKERVTFPMNYQGVSQSLMISRTPGDATTPCFEQITPSLQRLTREREKETEYRNLWLCYCYHFVAYVCKTWIQCQHFLASRENDTENHFALRHLIFAFDTN